MAKQPFLAGRGKTPSPEGLLEQVELLRLAASRHFDGEQQSEMGQFLMLPSTQGSEGAIALADTPRCGNGI